MQFPSDDVMRALGFRVTKLNDQTTFHRTATDPVPKMKIVLEVHAWRVGARARRPLPTQPEGEPMNTGADLIATERSRQINVEGHTTEHDAEHDDGALIAAAETYLSFADWQRRYPDSDITAAEFLGIRDDHTGATASSWPWAADDFKPSYRLRNLVKAGALIAAEIDRLEAESDDVSAVCNDCLHAWADHGRHGCQINGSGAHCRCSVANYA